jgi:hypothetical protein
MPSRVPLQVLSGHCPIDELPDELDLSEFADDMERLWAKSIARLDEGVVMEHAATIVMRPDGSLKLVHEVVGSSLNVMPNFTIAAPNMFIGTFHTHPRTDGLLPMPFSATDFVSAIQLRERLSVLYSDQIAFALVRTASIAAHADPIAVENEFNFFAIDIDAQDRDLLLDAIWAANKWLAEKYLFGLYMGTSEKLYREI